MLFILKKKTLEIVRTSKVKLLNQFDALIIFELNIS